jgi:hypothetical protein
MKNTYLSKGQTAAAQAVQKEIDDLVGRTNATPPVRFRPVGRARPVPRTLKIPANRVGEPIGNFKKGDRIIIEYEDGVWTHWSGKVASSSPDAPDGSRLKIMGQPKGELRLDVVVPTDTKANPFEYVFEEDVKDVMLGMGDPTYSDNAGTVAYKIIIYK